MTEAAEFVMAAFAMLVLISMTEFGDNSLTRDGKLPGNGLAVVTEIVGAVTVNGLAMIDLALPAPLTLATAWTLPTALALAADSFNVGSDSQEGRTIRVHGETESELDVNELTGFVCPDANELVTGFMAVEVAMFESSKCRNENPNNRRRIFKRRLTVTMFFTMFFRIRYSA